MIYGLYLSASGIIANSHKQDVVANNLANAETAGFKRDLPLFQQRLTEFQQRRQMAVGTPYSDPVREGIGGGLFVAPGKADQRQGDMEHTGAPLDVAIEGEGYFAVRPAAGDGAATPTLTRDGQFMLDKDGYVVLGTEAGQRVLGADNQPIKLDPSAGGKISIGKDGTITQGADQVGRLGLFAVADKGQLVKQGGNLMTYPDPAGLRPATGVLHGEFVERSNVDPTGELTELMRTQRLLEANANLIRYQDQTLAKLVNEVGKIS